MGRSPKRKAQAKGMSRNRVTISLLATRMSRICSHQ